MGQVSTVDKHPDRKRVIADIAEGKLPNTRIATKYNLKEPAIRYYREHLLPAKLVKAAEAKERMTIDKLLDALETNLSECVRSVADAKATGDHNTKIKAIREWRETEKVLLQAAGQLTNGTTVNVGVSINTFLASPKWQEIKRTVVSFAEAHLTREKCLELSHRLRRLEKIP